MKEFEMVEKKTEKVEMGKYGDNQDSQEIENNTSPLKNEIGRKG